METNDKKRKNTNYIHQQEFKGEEGFINKLKNKIISNDSIIIALIGQNGSKKQQY
ncbi:hypothetical protein [Mycoplasmopsis adleri]|uniref:hypothetical protein n=1 Tax=Mycoplasmopsis adleri TaxID=51362 RepID=UPI0038737A3E